MDTKDLHSDIKRLQEHIEAKLDEEKVDLIKWLISIAIVQTILIVVFVKFL